ncbi:PH domain-containing protein [Amycolatopsis endophytica]|uniref:Putative membrane protein n=1 Tax=Amycolatopsis endophytica TaxID=860233 RepID=A0A853B294_9PSEU|nr:PH domain-containing protein [Amycolatopsis endophytica]NYI88934.1 putative membrane protein [Amycolatopsis endophytica]
MTWQRPHPRSLLVDNAWLAAPLGSAALTLLATGGRGNPQMWITLGTIAIVFAVITACGMLRRRVTRYRVTGDAFELVSGLFTRHVRKVPLTRIRNVDLTAPPVHRVLGLVVVRVGTAGEGELRLDALDRPAAEALRARLARPEPSDEPVLATWNPRWIRYAPLTFWAVGGVFVAAGSLYRVLDGFGIEPWRIGVVREAFSAFGASALWLTIPVLLLGILMLGSAGAVALYIENWWRFRVEWTGAGALGVRRGLFTTRSVTMDRARLRGVQLAEPLPLRAGGGAKVSAVAGGLGDEDETRHRSAVLPPAPLAEALRVVRRVAGHAVFGRTLIPHPPVARRRRFRRGMLFVVLPLTAAMVVPGVVFGPGYLLGGAAFLALATPVTAWLARDAYRNLGHGFDEEFLIARAGTFTRRTTALQRSGVVAWTFTSSPFTRRAGLVTLTAAVAAGEQGYRIPDLDTAHAEEFAETAAPGILTEFLAPAWESAFTQPAGTAYVQA